MRKWYCALLTVLLVLLLGIPAYAALPAGTGIITSCHQVSGSEFSSKSSIAKKLDNMFAGNIGLYKNPGKTTLVDAALGTRNVPNNNVYQYWGPESRAGTSCYAYANAFYGHFYDGVYPHHRLNGNHKIIKAKGKISYANFVKWGVRNDAVVYIREGNHSIIVLHYDENYITYVDGNGNAKGLIALRKEAWKRGKGANIYDQRPSLIVQPTTAYFPAGSMNREKAIPCTQGGSAHDWDNGAVTQKATCKDTGKKVYTCQACGKTKEETLKKTTDHTYGEWTVAKEPTCSTKGQNVALCSVCGKEKTKTIKALGHKYGKSQAVQEGTIWSPGITQKTCKTCGYVKKTKSSCIVQSEEFGITFTTKEKVFPKKTELSVNAPEDAQTIMVALRGVSAQALLFEPKTVLKDEPVQPKGIVHLEIRIPEDFSKNLGLYQVSQGEAVSLPSSIDTESGVLLADVESFGVFALCDLNVAWKPEPRVTAEPEPTQSPTEAPTTQPEPTQPETRESFFAEKRELVIWAALAGVLIAAFVTLLTILIVRFHKRKKAVTQQ